MARSKAKEPSRQFELTREFYYRPSPTTLTRVRAKTGRAFRTGELTRNEWEVLEMLFEVIERCFQT